MSQIRFSYATHRWKQDEQDPICEDIWAACQARFGRGISKLRAAEMIAKEAPNVSQWAIRNWLYGRVTSPTNSKLQAALEGLGYRFAIVSADNKSAKLFSMKSKRRPARAKSRPGVRDNRLAA